jgi:hypothetical protein
MAKISARGDRAEYRWANAGGRTLVLTKQGLLLAKDHRRTGYRLVARHVTIEDAQRRAQEHEPIVWPSWWRQPTQR